MARVTTTVWNGLFATGIALSLMMSGASAQMAGGGHKHHSDTAKTEPQKPKADEKAYVQAIGSLPDKSYDPWHTLR